MKRISLLIDQETYNSLNKLLDELGITNRSAFLRNAIASYVNGCEGCREVLSEVRSLKALLLKAGAGPAEKPQKTEDRRSAAIAAFSRIGAETTDEV